MDVVCILLSAILAQPVFFSLAHSFALCFAILLLNEINIIIAIQQYVCIALKMV